MRKFFFFLRFYLFLDRGEGREKERERNINVWYCLSHTPHWGPGLQPRCVPWLGIELVTLWFTGWHSTTEPHQPGQQISFKWYWMFLFLEGMCWNVCDLKYVCTLQTIEQNKLQTTNRTAYTYCSDLDKLSASLQFSVIKTW